MGVKSVRERNPRGQGTRLSEEIVDAASALLEETGREESLSLRAVARRANITAPSIYAHFADREAILDAVIGRAFGEIIAAVESEREGVTDPVASLHAGCLGYLRFARERPHRYRVLFGRDRDPQARPPARGELDELVGSAAFNVLVDAIATCAAAGRSDSTDPFADATVLWAAMHGLASLQQGLPLFPWPDREQLELAIINRLARVRES
jgi:AcrR family transcriptional regulator